MIGLLWSAPPPFPRRIIVGMLGIYIAGVVSGAEDDRVLEVVCVCEAVKHVKPSLNCSSATVCIHCAHLLM